MLFPVLALVMLSAPPATRASEDAARQPRLGCSEPPAVETCADGRCRTVVFFKPEGCQLKRRTRTRRTYTCEQEARLEVTARGRRIIATQKLALIAPRNPYPSELIGQWRRCPFRTQRKLERLGTVYEDPDVGRCVVLRLDAGVPVNGKRHGYRLLKSVHPYIASCTRSMVARAKAAGHHVRVISGQRAPKRHRGQWRGGGWHAFGLAVDIYVGRYGGLKKATAAFLRGETATIWRQLGDWGEACGLRWLGRKDPDEIFHFEWHPGFPGWPDGALFQQLAKTLASRGLRGVWRALRPKRARRGPFRHLQDH